MFVFAWALLFEGSQWGGDVQAQESLLPGGRLKKCLLGKNSSIGN